MIVMGNIFFKSKGCKCVIIMKLSWVKTAIVVIASLMLLIAVLLLPWKKHIINYTEPKGHLSQGDYADSSTAYDGTLRVVTWNLHFGENLDEAITTLENISELQDTDLLLLQEIDAEGVEKIAKGLHYNYSYYPTVFSRQRQKEYGIAILSKWPLKDTDKILLPNWFPGWVENRYAVKAVTSVKGRDFTVYNVHLDVVWMEPQGNFLAGIIEQENNEIILGGDFNTWRPASIDILENSLENIGLERLTQETGYTFMGKGLRFTLDHIFSMQGLDYTAGVYRQTDASDHYPVWAEITIGAK
jgi:endonuclease/exonuclease/phosphatase family metal-dependent hydrolase